MVHVAPVAEGIRDGKAPHASAIEAKRETLYDWTRERCEEMFRRVFARDDAGAGARTAATG